MKDNTMPPPPTPEIAGHNSAAADSTGSRWLLSWSVLLATVFLFASALNCLFLWLSYGRSHDAAACIFSLVLALIVYFKVFSSARASAQKKFFYSMAALMIWAVLLPVFLRLF